jgi:acetaldehyde dehydrogenase/alcohol dehydrogenase
MEVFNHRTKIVFGENARDYLRQLEFEGVQHSGTIKACIATDKVVRDLGLLAKVTEILDALGYTYRVYDEILPDPTTDQIETGLKHIIETKPDLLIAVGGGSVIDAAKAIMHSCLNLKKALVGQYAVHKPTFVAIPTTSGTGSEVTSYSVVTNAQTHVKIPIVDEDMLPDVAILDPLFTKSVPPFITAVTGMDVMTHAFEALMSKDSTAFTDMLAKEALRLCFTYLSCAVQDGNDLMARTQMHMASCMAGMAFNSAGLGIGHALAHAVGGRYRISHGHANSIFLANTLRFNLLSVAAGKGQDSQLVKKMADVSRGLGLTENSRDASAIRVLVSKVERLTKSIGIKPGLRGAKVEMKQLKTDMPFLLETIRKDKCLLTSPIDPSDEEICRLLFESY